jgi:hypothetical protein
LHDLPVEIVQHHILKFLDKNDKYIAIVLIGSNDNLVQKIVEELVNNFGKKESNIEKILKQVGISILLYTNENNTKILYWGHLSTVYNDIAMKTLSKLSRRIKILNHDIEQSIKISQRDLVMKCIHYMNIEHLNLDHTRNFFPN